MRRWLKPALAAGVATCVLGGASIAVGFASSEDSSAAADSLCALMPDAIGLYKGNPVTQMGVEIGKVSEVTAMGDHVLVRMSLNENRRMPADVKAVTRSKSLLADRSLELVGNYRGGPALDRNECISLQNSFTPKSISEIAGSAADFIKAMAPYANEPNLKRAIGQMQKALEGTGPAGADMFRHASNAAVDPDGLISDFSAVLSNMAPLTSETVQRWSDLRGILDNLPEVVNEVNALWDPGVWELNEGMAYLIPVIASIQKNYGDDIWPVVNGPELREVVRVAATRSSDIAEIYGTVPVVAQFLKKQTTRGGWTFTYNPPARLAALVGAGGACAGNGSAPCVAGDSRALLETLTGTGGSK